MANRRASRWILAFGAMALGLALFELILRTLLPSPRFHRGPVEFDPNLGFRGVPDFSESWGSPDDPSRAHEVSLNRDGFRGRPLPTGPPEPGTRRIAFLGDSFLVAEAVPAGRLMTTRIEQSWPDSSSSVEVYNLSAIDYGTGQELLLLDRIGPRIRPSLTVLAVYAENDVPNNARGLAGATRVSPGDAIRPYVIPSEGNRGEREIQWAMPTRAVLRRLSRSFVWAERGLFPPGFAASGMTPLERVRRGDPPREFLEVYVRHADPEHRWERAWQTTEALIRAVRDRCDELDSDLLVLVIPSIHQVERNALGARFEIEARAAGGRLEDRVDWNSPEQRLRAFFAAEGIRGRFLTDAFRRAARDGERVYARDLHLSEAGHAIAAEVVLDAITSSRPGSDSNGGGGDGAGTATIASPVSWPAESDPSWLDLGRASHSRHFGNGWLAWRPADSGQPGGWWLEGPAALVAIRPVDGPFVVRGSVSEPVGLEMGFLGSATERLEIDRAGGFESRFLASSKIPVASGGHAVFTITRRAGAGRVFIEALGFEQARPTPEIATGEGRALRGAATPAAAR